MQIAATAVWHRRGEHVQAKWEPFTTLNRLLLRLSVLQLAGHFLKRSNKTPAAFGVFVYRVPLDSPSSLGGGHDLSSESLAGLVGGSCSDAWVVGQYNL
jgi:hypothetical protein